MIKIFCKGLPKKLSESLFNEYQYSYKQLNFLLTRYKNKYRWIHEVDKDLETTQLMLAMSIYYRNIIAHYDSIEGFTNRIINNEYCEGLVIGNAEIRELDREEINLVVRKFKQIMIKFAIPSSMFAYSDMTQYLQNLQRYLYILEKFDET
jgi:uncharacterized protein Smg (DUF494 family)